jgi:hypothetical protein
MNNGEMGRILGALEEAKREHGKQLDGIFSQLLALHAGQSEVRSDIKTIHALCPMHEARISAVEDSVSTLQRASKTTLATIGSIAAAVAATIAGLAEAVKAWGM